MPEPSDFGVLVDDLDAARQVARGDRARRFLHALQRPQPELDHPPRQEREPEQHAERDDGLDDEEMVQRVIDVRERNPDDQRCLDESGPLSRGDLERGGACDADPVVRRVDREGRSRLDDVGQRRGLTGESDLGVEDLAGRGDAHLHPGSRRQQRGRNRRRGTAAEVGEEQLRRVRRVRELPVDAADQIAARLAIRHGARHHEPDRREHDQAEEEPDAKRHGRSAFGRSPQRVANAPNRMY